MNNMSIKKGRLFPAIALGLLMLSACSQNEETPFVNDKDKTPGEVAIVATQGGSLTRMTHEDDGNDGLIVRWSAKDAFRVFSSDNKRATFTIPDGYIPDDNNDGKTATFIGNPEFSGTELNAFFPDLYAQTRWVDCYFSVMGQVQDATNPRAHLADYNFMTAKVTLDGTSVSNVQFTHHIAVLKIKFTLPEGLYPKSLTLSAQEDEGIVITQKASDPTNVSKAKLLVLTIRNATSNEHTAYMAVLPSTLTKQLAVAVTTNGMTHNYTVRFDGEFSYEAGYVYSAELDFRGE